MEEGRDGGYQTIIFYPKSTNISNTVFFMLKYSINIFLALTFTLAYKVSAQEIRYQYIYAGQVYSTLSAAEATMKSVDAKHQFLQQTGQQFNESTGTIDLNYTVPDRPAFQVEPTIYVGHNANCDPFCYSEAEAYAAFKLQQETTHCNVVLTPLGPYSEDEFFSGLGEGRVWSEGTAYIDKGAFQPFREDHGYNSANGCQGFTFRDDYTIRRWKPWGCIEPFRIGHVNSPYDTCRITNVTAKITAIPIQFCGPQTDNPIRPLTGDKYLSQNDIQLDGLQFTRFYHSINQTSGTHRFAPGWQHSYSQYLLLNSNNIPTYAVRENGNHVALLAITNSSLASADRVPLHLDLIGSTWELQLPSGQKEIYDTAGLLTSVINPAGASQTFTYDPSDRMTSIDADDGQYIHITYKNEYGRQIDMLSDHANRTYTYDYDLAGNLEYVGYPDGTSMQYHYEDTRYPDAVTGVTDQRSIRYSTFAYDDNGRALTSFLSNGIERVDIDYGITGVQTVTDSLGRQSSYTPYTSLNTILINTSVVPAVQTVGVETPTTSTIRPIIIY